MKIINKKKFSPNITKLRQIKLIWYFQHFFQIELIQIIKTFWKN